MIRGVSSGIRSAIASSAIPKKVFQSDISRSKQSKICFPRHLTQGRQLYSKERFKRSAVVGSLVWRNSQQSATIVVLDKRHFENLILAQNFSSVSTMSRHFSLGEGTLQVPMDLFALNRNRLCKSLKELPKLPNNSVVVLQGGQGVPRYCTDVEYLFRQESFFHWAYGVIEPDFYGVIEVDSGTSHLFIPKYPEAYAVWMGKIFDCDHYKQKYGVDQVHYVEEMAMILENAKAEVVLALKGMNTDSNLWTREAVFEGMSKFKIDNELLHPVIVEW